MKHFSHQAMIALRLSIVTLILTGLLYPALVTGVAQLLFPEAANGSLVNNDRGQVVGSALIGQPFANPGYFQPRPSAAGNGYDATSSGGSNLGPTSQALRKRATDDIARLQAANPDAVGPVPASLITASASGLDPDLPPDGAFWQVPRIAKARGVGVERVIALLKQHMRHRQFGFLGVEHINVLDMNMALDRLFGSPPPQAAVVTSPK